MLMHMHHITANASDFINVGSKLRPPLLANCLPDSPPALPTPPRLANLPSSGCGAGVSGQRLRRSVGSAVRRGGSHRARGWVGLGRMCGLHSREGVASPEMVMKQVGS